MGDLKFISIKDFRPGDIVQNFFYVRESEVKTTANNNKYLDMTLSDATGDVNAKYWDSSPENATMFPAGIIIKVRGTVQDYQGKLQFRVENIRRSTESDNLQIEQYIPSAPERGEDLLAEIKTVLAGMKDRELADFTAYVLGKYEDRLVHFPAAKKNHHAVRDGLLYHTVTMLRSARAIVKVYDFLNADLLYTGVILHDVGKMEEMEATPLGLVEDYTAGGKLLGHLVQGINIVAEAAKETGLDPEKALVLEHMILAHHYEPEFGSPKYPMVPEGEILHYLDIMDARMYDMRKALEGTEPGHFTEKIWSLDNRTVYKPKWN